MTIASVAHGTITADGTAQALGSALTAAGSYIVTINRSNMVDGDVLQIRYAKKVLTGDASELPFDVDAYYDAPDVGHVIVEGDPHASLYSLVITLQQTGSGFRSFDWDIALL